MSIKTYLFRLDRIHQLISKSATGNPDQFARKLGLDRSMLYKYLSIMKELGAPIAYNRATQNYYYTRAVAFSPYFTPLHDEAMEKQLIAILSRELSPWAQ